VPYVVKGHATRTCDVDPVSALGSVLFNAAFESLPGASFTVNGAAMPPNSALTTAGAQLFLSPRWSLLAKFEGEFAKGSQTYAGSGTLRYTRTLWPTWALR
jgi:uncharacterized protein with beta-barrel porin domain